MEATIIDYMNAAIERQRLRSDRGLARVMNLEQAIVSRWRTGKAYPKDHQMRWLAQLAEANEEQALALLGTWTATDEPTTMRWTGCPASAITS